MLEAMRTQARFPHFKSRDAIPKNALLFAG
jgi:hypothetical protein